MGIRNKLGIIVSAIVLVVTVSWFVWNKQEGSRVEKCGDVVLEGYLVFDCPWQTLPSLPEYKSDNGYQCFLDVWLSETKPEGQIPGICRSQPMTSTCFLEKISPFGVESRGLGEYPNVTLVGKYKNINLCSLNRKCLDPECEELCLGPECKECGERSVFIPCALTEK